ncbi:hypothetical protein [Agreia sp. VKM Ac-1783]|uniref:hypothetical protein n=1 Tax=Agreia sp. VKM Ac-1783 TaxID=1938889 RepID=UPI000A2AAA77|nr:hypothetical protein [Agreia sp. VKM Ac-1783]SMQ75011.1 hypothetical protein SAMN06295943_3411 [Agreia sp. VKM Ac-1783]
MTVRSRLFARIGASVAAVSLSVLAAGALASPAAAASSRTLPDGSSMYAISCDTDLTDLSLFSVDATTAAATLVNNGTPDSADCASQSAWNAATSVAYFVAWQETGPAILATVDTTTGVSEPVGTFTIDGTPVRVSAIAIGRDGAAYAISVGALYSLDLGTAALTEIRDLNIFGLYGFAADPTTGAFYGVASGGGYYAIDVVNGTATLLGNTGLAEINDVPSSLQIDSRGTLWVVTELVDEVGDHSRLWSIDPSDISGSAQLSGEFTAATGQFRTYSLLFVPGVAVPAEVPLAPADPVVAPAAVPTLANTGVDAAPIAAGGALVAMLGLALLVPGIRRRANV